MGMDDVWKWFLLELVGFVGNVSENYRLVQFLLTNKRLPRLESHFIRTTSLMADCVLLRRLNLDMYQLFRQYPAQLVKYHLHHLIYVLTSAH